MTSINTGITVDSDLWDRMEEERGDVPRSKFIKRALEFYMDSEQTAKA